MNRPATPILASSLAGLLLAATAATQPARADVDWKTVMTGVDGIVVYCSSTTREDYAPKICDTVAAAVVEGFADSGLPVADAGMVYTGAAEKPGEATDPHETRAKNDFANPLYMRVHIKGTDDDNPAIYVSLRAALAFKAAVETGSDLPGKAGDLVISEIEAVANGPRRQLPAFIASNIAKRTGVLIGEIKANK